MLELYNYPMSTCSQKVRLALAEKGLVWKSRHVAIDKGEHLEDWYLKLNPNAVVPTLVHDGAPVVDSSVINEYLEDAFPEPALRPANLVKRAAVRAWRQFIDEVTTPAIRYPTFNALISRGYSGMTEEEFAHAAERRPLRKHFYRRMGRNGFSDTDIAMALEQLHLSLLRMNCSLQQGPWLTGDEFTLADISMMPSIVRLEDLKRDDLWADLPRVADWYERMKSRPSFSLVFFPGARDIYGYRQDN